MTIKIYNIKLLFYYGQTTCHQYADVDVLWFWFLWIDYRLIFLGITILSEMLNHYLTHYSNGSQSREQYERLDRNSEESLSPYFE